MMVCWQEWCSTFAQHVAALCDDKRKCPQVFTVEMHHKRVESAGPGDNVGMNIKGLDKGNMPRAGDVMIMKKDESLKHVEVCCYRCLYFTVERKRFASAMPARSFLTNWTLLGHLP